MTRLSIILFFFAAFQALGQIEVKGVVRDQWNAPLAGVNIVAKGSVIGTITDGQGAFVLKIPFDSAVVIFTFIGYDAQVLKISHSQSVNIVLVESKSVSGGYWETRKNAKPISKKRIETGTVTTYSLEEVLLQGIRLSGVVAVWQKDKYKVLLPLDSLVAELNTNYAGAGDVDQAIKFLHDNIKGDTVVLSSSFIQSVGDLMLNNLAIELLKKKSIAVVKPGGGYVKSLVVLDVLWVARGGQHGCWGGIEFLVNEKERAIFTITHFIC